MEPPPLSLTLTHRLLSLDFLRGLVMVILLLGETSFFYKFHTAFDNSFTSFLFYQSEHSAWHGLRFWDVILPAFMMIAGTSMAFSYKRQQELHYTWRQSFIKILKRSFWLLFWGVLMYSVGPHGLNLEFTSVLVELSFATLISFLIIRWRAGWQLAISLFLLLLTEFLYRFSNIPGFDHPFTDQHNFGNYVDLILINRVSQPSGTSTLNLIPCAASTIWGLISGQLLLSNKSAQLKFKCLVGFGLIALLTGCALDWTGVTPMLKWMASSSFVLTTGGISLIVLAICYWWIDIRKHQRYLRFFTIVGMNSIFIYLFYNFIGNLWLNGYMNILCSGSLNLINIPVEIGELVSCLVIFTIEWYLCYFLYKKKIFFKL